MDAEMLDIRIKRVRSEIELLKYKLEAKLKEYSLIDSSLGLLKSRAEGSIWSMLLKLSAKHQRLANLLKDTSIDAAWKQELSVYMEKIQKI